MRLDHPASLALAFTFALASCAAPPRLVRTDTGRVAPLPAPTNSVALLVGSRELDDESEPLEDQSAFGIEAAFSGLRVGPAFELGYSTSSEREDLFVPGLGVFDTELELQELYFGLRTPPPDSAVRPYLGGGLTLVDAELTASDGFTSVSESDTVPALYLHAGIQAVLLEHLVLGVDLRSTFGAAPEFAGVEIDVDYFQVAAMVGVCF